MTHFQRACLAAIAASLLLLIAVTVHCASPAHALAGATLTVSGATLTDMNTGTIYNVGLQANESSGQAGIGDVLLTLSGPALSLCTAHGPTAQIDPNTQQGNFPLTGIQCGRAFGMSIGINGCTANVTAHGYVHADYPNVSYLGMTTFDVHFDKTAGTLSVVVHTPKSTTTLSGSATGAVSMSTCP